MNEHINENKENPLLKKDYEIEAASRLLFEY